MRLSRIEANALTSALGGFKGAELKVLYAKIITFSGLILKDFSRTETYVSKL